MTNQIEQIFRKLCFLQFDRKSTSKQQGLGKIGTNLWFWKSYPIKPRGDIAQEKSIALPFNHNVPGIKWNVHYTAPGFLNLNDKNVLKWRNK